ncbi:MAG: helix-turn-helix domain-containing protein [Gammaproteobacteria bacterium]|nr:helix-turn-helix domain-containing protein [Gammaproteobacteria bacterium]
MNDLLTPEEVAKIMGTKVSTLSVWRSTGRYQNLPFIKVGRLVRYRVEDVENFLNDRKRYGHNNSKKEGQ